jgi:hypothetical protein
MSAGITFNEVEEQGMFNADTLHFISKTTPGNAPSSGTKLYSLNGMLSWLNSDGYTRTLDGVLTASRVYTLPDTSDTIVTVNATQTLTNKTITSNTNNVTAKGLFSATTTVNVSASSAPTAGQVLTATSPTTATWQAPNPNITCYQATDPNALNMTSTSYTLISGMTVTPTQTGTYLVLFDTAFYSNDTNLVKIAIYRNGSIVSDSERLLGDSMYNAATTATIITWTSGAVEARMAVTSGSTVTVYKRSLYLLRIS